MIVPFLDLKASYQELKIPIDEAVARVLNSGWYVLGDEVEQFEERFAAYCGASFCIGVGNGFDALELSLRALDIGPGDEVIVPANTYIATWLAVSAVGATCVPVEPEATGCNIDIDRIEEVISPKTQAILPVHLYGHPVNMERINLIAKTHGLKIVEDCAQAHGARWQNTFVGSTADLGAYSYYPSKNLGALGDGGGVVTSDAELARKLRQLRNYGSTEKYRNDVRGINSRLDPIQAAILNVKLDHLDAWNNRRTIIAERYLESFNGIPVTPTYKPEGGESVWHIFSLETENRDELIQHLGQAGVSTLIHYPVPPHLSAAYVEEGFNELSFPITEKKAKELLSLPIGPHLSEEQTTHVIAEVEKFFST